MTRKAIIKTNVPSRCVTAGGIDDKNRSQYEVINAQSANQNGKPTFHVPPMSEISEVQQTGIKVASLFAGCGGSCLGYRIAGFKVVWANEFVAHAQECYRANFSETILDCRDVRTIQPEEILEAIGLKKGELDLLDGSPPCQAFSTAGKREKGWGKERQYENGQSQKNETLFDEYVRLLCGLMPKVFVAENVSGLAKGVAKGFFLNILAALKSSGYAVECRLLDAQWLGVPQQRQRLIFIGVRSDLKLKPAFPKPLPYRYSVADACSWINGNVVHEIGGFAKTNCRNRSSPAITATQCRITATTEQRKLTIAELKRICAFPDDFILTGSYAQQWARLGNAVPPVMMAYIACTIRDEILNK